jgi:hypothetical protein
MIRYISLAETMPARSAALRNNAPFSECGIPEDSMENCFHLGYELEGEIVGTASFFPVNLAAEKGKGFQLRLMGVKPDYQGKSKIKSSNSHKSIKRYLLCPYTNGFRSFLRI